MSIGPGLRFKVLARDGFTCRYCGATGLGVALHIDHLWPKARGGRDEIDNLVTACSTCNLGKLDMLLDPMLLRSLIPYQSYTEEDYEAEQAAAKAKERPAKVPKPPRQPKGVKPPKVLAPEDDDDDDDIAWGIGGHMPYIAADTPARRWQCRSCGMVCSLEGDVCSCDKPREPRFYCDDCGESITRDDDEDNRGRCEDCYYEICRECFENPRAWIDQELNDWCESCLEYEQEVAEQAEKVGQGEMASLGGVPL